MGRYIERSNIKQIRLKLLCDAKKSRSEMIVTNFYNCDEQEKLWNPDDDFLPRCGVLSNLIKSRKPKIRVLLKSDILCRFNKMVKNQK